MKTLAYIIGEAETRIALSFDNNHLFAESFGEPTTEVGPYFATEEDAVEWIQDSYGTGTWQLTWKEA